GRKGVSWTCDLLFVLRHVPYPCRVTRGPRESLSVWAPGYCSRLASSQHSAGLACGYIHHSRVPQAHAAYGEGSSIRAPGYRTASRLPELQCAHCRAGTHVPQPHGTNRARGEIPTVGAPSDPLQP